VTRRLRPEEDLVVGLAIAFVLSMASLFVTTLTSREVEILACVALRLSYAVLTSRAVSAAPRQSLRIRIAGFDSFCKRS
jgi:hypothetical protein